MRAVIIYKKGIPGLKSTREVLEKAGFKVKPMLRRRLKRQIKADLVVTLGGDGTLLVAVPYVGDVPLIGVNAFPGKSVGFFCAATIKNFEKYINRIIQKKIKITKLPLLEAKIAGKAYPRFALNEFLLTSSNAAGTSRYRLLVNGKYEEQRSSGIWICTGPGSTAASKSAGGKILPLESKRLQFIVREPCTKIRPRHTRKRGLLKLGQKFTAISNMSSGMIYADGRTLGYRWDRDQKVQIKIAKQTLALYL